MKKNNLYTANRWNQPAFMPEKNLFPNGGSTSPFGVNLSAPTVSTPKIDLSNPLAGLNTSQLASLKAFNLSADMTPTLPTSNLGLGNMGKGGMGSLSETDPAKFFGLGVGAKKGSNLLGKAKDFANSSTGGALIGGLTGAVGQIGGNLIGGGLESSAGNTISSIGSTVGGAISSVNPVLGGIVSVGSGLVGGLTNRMFGTKVDQAKLNAANEGTAAYNNFQSNASSFDDVKGPTAQASVQDAYSGGLFSSGSARRKNEDLKRARLEARQLAFRAVDNNINNIVDDQMNNALANYSAFGGPIETGDIGAINYGFMSDYLTQKKRENDMKSKMSGIVPMPAFMPNSYAIGGDLQMNGADWNTGLTHIDAGGSHEENPYEGIQLGTDENGIPNLVEEGETIFNDYVFSNRILADEATKQMFRLPKKKEITVADISKRLEKEIAETPNDPISKAGFEKQMQILEEQQERQKQEMEVERAKVAFEALSPEEQTALMQQRAEQEAMTQQAAIQQPTPKELTMTQQQQIQQMQQADGSNVALGQEPQMNCFGGKINRFDLGGNILKSLGIHTLSDFKKWVKDNKAASNGFDWDAYQSMDDIPWDDLLKSADFQAALFKDNPALADALKRGYDFGTYRPTSNGKATIQSISRGNWNSTNGRGWRGSDDLAFKQATEGLSDAEIDALTTEQLAERMKGTAAYQNTNKWLQNPDNALQYLNTLLNDPDTPEVARKYARKFVQNGKWRDGFNYDYATVFGSDGKGVRETNPGTYWHTALEANRGNQTGNFVINEDGTIEPIIGDDVPTDWTSAGKYTWSDEGNDYVYNYYKRPVVPPSEKKKNTAPIHRLEELRYAGLFGPAANLGLMAAGVGRPNKAQLDAAIQGAGDVTTADWKPLGNYLTYRPLDIWYEQNALNAQSRATDRALVNNSGGNRGTAMAGLLTNGYNSQLASGNLFRQAQEYNDNLRKQVADFNRVTDQFNSEQYGATSRFNADAYNRARQANAQMRLQAAAQKMDADAGWYNSLYGNISGLFKGIGDIGTENYRMNRIAEMAARGDFGTATDKTYGFGHVLKSDKKKAKGGKINKKRGLII